MRTLIDISDADLNALKNLSQAKHVSRASLIREAVSQYLEKQRGCREIAGFGLWKDSGHEEDGMEYQDRMRSEWRI